MSATLTLKNSGGADRREAGPSRTVVNLRSVRSGDLFGGERELLIEHAGEHYSLRVTSNNKLILTK